MSSMSGKLFATSAIILVVVVMGFSTIAPALQQAFAHDVTEQKGKEGTRICPRGFRIGLTDVGVILTTTSMD
jgi:hypothetical protein